MTVGLKLVLLVLSFVLFVVGTTNFVQGESRLKVVSLGLASYIASLIF